LQKEKRKKRRGNYKKRQGGITRKPGGEITKNLEGITRNQNRNQIRQKNHPGFYCITAPS
jgi:hypothetical protein